ncbi:unnamed protein product [Cylindrotheca closterium]|uniref:Uncharacterized protein n=1 Tax=Cylindrotheca closterium TaxID=2856 RepID=A0AAD2CTF7_9STRA|nr:unnamed protein product [Cylindrotheca closterium]
MPRSTRRSDPGGPVIVLQDTTSLSRTASVLPGSAKDKERWRQGKKSDLTELVESELRQLVEDYPLTLEEVKTVGFAIKNQQQKQLERGDANGVSASYSSQDLDSPRTQLALRLNSVSKDLAKMRFSLVPSRLKEPIFWDATLYLMKERLNKYNAERCRTNGGIASTNGTVPVIPNAAPPNGNGNGLSTYILEEQLAKKDSEIANLKKQLQDVQETLLDVAKLPSSNTSTGTSTSHPTTNGTSSSSSSSSSQHNKSNHKGQWKMDKDSEEFLGYPEEVKEAMRAEKQKRLRQVQDELKFILDSDSIEDSRGQWDCCGGTTYHAECSSRASF